MLQRVVLHKNLCQKRPTLKKLLWIEGRGDVAISGRYVRTLTVGIRVVSFKKTR